jgi:hypothetical protein
MAFPVLDERAEVVYHRPHSRIKRKFDDADEEVNEGRPYT